METENLRLILAQNIKARRKELGITQVKLAELADISEPYMNDIERCQTWVSDKTLVKLAQSLHVPACELFRSPDAAFSPQTGAGSERARYAAFQQKKKDLYDFLDNYIEGLYRICT